MSVSPIPDTGQAAAALPPRWQRGLFRGPPGGGFRHPVLPRLTALLSLLTAIGATFLTTDATLKPLPAVSLVSTIEASGFTWRRHRTPLPLLPLLPTVFASGVIVSSLYGDQLFGHAASISPQSCWRTWT